MIILLFNTFIIFIISDVVLKLASFLRKVVYSSHTIKSTLDRMKNQVALAAGLVYYLFQ